MASERGLPSIPRGLDRGLTTYLQGIHSVLASLSGLARNSETTRAVRVSEGIVAGPGSSGQSFTIGSILTRHIASGAVTSDKLADGCVTEKKLADNAVTAKAILPGSVGRDALSAASVTEDKLADGAVTAGKMADASIAGDKLRAGTITDRELAAQCVGGDELKPRSVAATHIADGVLPTGLEGAAEHGETVDLGAWLERPGVAVAGFALNVQAGGILRVGIENLRQSDGSWLFDAVACCDMGEDESGAQAVVTGQIAWRATGRRRTDDE